MIWHKLLSVLLRITTFKLIEAIAEFWKSQNYPVLFTLNLGEPFLGVT